MSVYVYRPTTKTIATTSGRRAVLHECMGPGPRWGASDRAVAAWDRKIEIGHKRATLPEFKGAGLFAESDEDGAPVYEGSPAVYTDGRDYKVARDEHGREITVVNSRKRNAVIEVVPAGAEFDVFLKIGGDLQQAIGRSADRAAIVARAETIAREAGARKVYVCTVMPFPQEA